MLAANIFMQVFIIAMSAALSWDGEEFHWRYFGFGVFLATFTWYAGLWIGNA